MNSAAHLDTLERYKNQKFNLLPFCQIAIRLKYENNKMSPSDIAPRFNRLVQCGESIESALVHVLGAYRAQWLPIGCEIEAPMRALVDLARSKRCVYRVTAGRASFTHTVNVADRSVGVIHIEAPSACTLNVFMMIPALVSKVLQSVSRPAILDGALIAYIDDCKLNHLAIKATLSDSGARLRSYFDPIEATKNLPGEHPDLVLIDYSMPDINGHQVGLILRDRGINCPLVCITGHSPQHLDEINPELHDFFSSVIPKGLDQPTLLSILAMLLGSTGGHGGHPSVKV